MHKRLVDHELVQHRKSALLGPYVAECVQKRKDAGQEDRTVRKWRTTERKLNKHWGETRDLRTITPGDAKDYHLMLQSLQKTDPKTKELVPKYRPSTLHKEIEIARQFFEAAFEDRVIDRNPFAKIKCSKKPDDSRKRIIPEEVVDACIEAAPNAHWRLIIALARYGGLRCPSEHSQLAWEDIKWDKEYMTVHVPKLKRYDGKETRTVPLFPKLLPYLRESFELAPEGAVEVLPDVKRDSNLRTTFEKIIERAGVKKWPKLFQNLRVSLQNELEKEHPTHIVCSIIGNSPKVARENYLFTSDDDRADVLTKSKQREAEKKSQRNAQQQAAAMPGIVKLGEEAERQPPEKTLETLALSPIEIAVEGLEPPTRGL